MAVNEFDMFCVFRSMFYVACASVCMLELKKIYWRLFSQRITIQIPHPVRNICMHFMCRLILRYFSSFEPPLQLFLFVFHAHVISSFDDFVRVFIIIIINFLQMSFYKYTRDNATVHCRCSRCIYYTYSIYGFNVGRLWQHFGTVTAPEIMAIHNSRIFFVRILNVEWCVSSVRCTIWMCVWKNCNNKTSGPCSYCSIFICG